MIGGNEAVQIVELIADARNRVTEVSSIKEAVLFKIISNVKVEGNCWIWQGQTSGNKEQTRGHGYGRISVHGHTSAVHRVMWTLVHGYIPAKKQVDHICSNRLCCNPDHLEMVTHKENQRRRRLKK